MADNKIHWHVIVTVDDKMESEYKTQDGRAARGLAQRHMANVARTNDELKRINPLSAGFNASVRRYKCNDNCTMTIDEITTRKYS
jgi:hypothetical protein